MNFQATRIPNFKIEQKKKSEIRQTLKYGKIKDESSFEHLQTVVAKLMSN